MSFYFGPIYTCGTKCECISENAHKDLSSFEDVVEKWESGDPTQKKRSKRIVNLLYGLADLKSDCWRFFYKTFNELSSVDSELRVKHPHYWDTWGRVAGGVLGAEFDLRSAAFDSWTIFKPRVHEFAAGDWELRSLLIKAFRGIARQCAQWDDSLERSLEYYYTYCWATISILRRKPPRAVSNSIEWLLESWYLIAEKCEEERGKLLQGTLSEDEAARKSIQIEKTVCQIVAASFPLLKIIDRMSELHCEKNMQFWIHWVGMLFERTFSENNLTGPQRSLIMTENVGNELKDFFTKCSDFLRNVKDGSNKRMYQERLQECAKILADFGYTEGNGSQ